MTSQACINTMAMFVHGHPFLDTVVFDKLVRIYGNNGSPVDVIYLDFQKAFDKVPHQRLLIELKLHGMGVNIVT